MENVKCTFPLPRELRNDMKFHCFKNGITMAEYLRVLVEEDLGVIKPKKVKKKETPIIKEKKIKEEDIKIEPIKEVDEEVEEEDKSSALIEKKDYNMFKK
ncbi:MAG: hypothetical protein DRI86_07460 [Bacteroidetes bacterium]|nr:MAG: hypothetical protein DRI86_07460 [Bacteroidota bacterium]